GSPRDLPVPAERAWVRARVSDHAGTGRALAFLPLPILPSTKSTASALRICAFRGSMAGPHLPLSTLRRAPHGTLRMTRGQCGSLYLSLCKTFTHYSLPVSRRTDFCKLRLESISRSVGEMYEQFRGTKRCCENE